MSLADSHLVLFMTRSTPLSEWFRLGILEREVALYRALRPYLAQISVVTSGGERDLAYQERLGDVRILCNRWGLSPNAYSLLAPFLHCRALREATIYKTNQLDGAWTALIAGRVHHRPVIVRAGYPWALNYQRAAGKPTLKGHVIWLLERLALRMASRVVVTTSWFRTYAQERHRVSPDRISVIPNYVDTNLFRPHRSTSAEPRRILFVGSLKAAKNLSALLHAVAQLDDVHLVIAGDGPLGPSLEAQAAALGIHVSFVGRIPNEELPAEINSASAFVLPSLYEGHPKALIEAMACGCAVVGSDVSGIRDVVQHDKTGLLCEPSSDGLATALRRVLAEDTLRERLGRAARTYSVQEYSLERVVRSELAVLAEVNR
jgi:glycosyltransferase involved in cell wall biosynthesis